MKRTAILFSGTSHCFKYSIKSLMQNVIIPNNADVFILTSKWNVLRKAPSTNLITWESDPEEMHRKATTIIRDESKYFSKEDELFIRDVFGDRLKILKLIDDIPGYNDYLIEERNKLKQISDDYKQVNIRSPFNLDVNIPAIINQYNHVKKCYELMKNYEEQNNFEYDCIVRMRLDFIAPFKFDFSQYYINENDSNLYNCGSFRGDAFEWADEFCFFGSRNVMQKLLSNIDRMGFIEKQEGKNTMDIYNEKLFAPETQFSLLLYELDIPVINLKIYRSSCYTNGNDGYDYMTYLFRKES